MKRKLSPDHPDVIADKAAKMPWKANTRVNITGYEKAIVTLQQRGYSFGEIAEWLSKELGAPVKRGQVYYVYQQYLAEGAQVFEEAEARGDIKYLPHVNLSEEEAEEKAKEADKAKGRKGP